MDTVMAYYQVNLASASKPVRDSFKEFAHVDADLDGNTIIIAASDAEIDQMLRQLQLSAAARDEEFQFPAEMQEVKPSQVINGKALREHFQEALTNGC